MLSNAHIGIASSKGFCAIGLGSNREKQRHAAWLSLALTVTTKTTKRVERLHAIAQLAIGSYPNYRCSDRETVQQTVATANIASVPLVSASSSQIVAPIVTEPESTDGGWFGRCLGDFHAIEYGEEYVSLRRGELVRRSRGKKEDQGYAYGWNASGEEGWFPAAFWQEESWKSKSDVWHERQADIPEPLNVPKDFGREPLAGSRACVSRGLEVQGADDACVNHVLYSQFSMSDHSRNPVQCAESTGLTFLGAGDSSDALTREVLVDLIDYSQPNMSSNFSDGRPLHLTIEELDNGWMDPLRPRFPIIEVALLSKEGRYISKDHRRLYCLKKHQENSGRRIKTTVKVFAEVHDKRAFWKLVDRYNPVNEGRDIRLRRSSRHHRP